MFDGYRVTTQLRTIKYLQCEIHRLCLNITNQQQSTPVGISSHFRSEPARVSDPVKPAHDRRQPDGPGQLSASAFNRLDHNGSSAGNRAYCYAELAVTSLAVAETITSTHCAYPRRDGQAELAWVAGYTPRCNARPKTWSPIPVLTGLNVEYPC